MIEWLIVHVKTSSAFPTDTTVHFIRTRQVQRTEIGVVSVFQQRSGASNSPQNSFDLLNGKSRLNACMLCRVTQKLFIVFLGSRGRETERERERAWRRQLRRHRRNFEKRNEKAISCATVIHFTSLWRDNLSWQTRPDTNSAFVFIISNHTHAGAQRSGDCTCSSRKVCSIQRSRHFLLRTGRSESHMLLRVAVRFHFESNILTSPFGRRNLTQSLCLGKQNLRAFF